MFAISGATTLIDISKPPEIALSLNIAKAAQVFVLNVVRDPRAVACNWQAMGLMEAALDVSIDAWKIRRSHWIGIIGKR